MLARSGVANDKGVLYVFYLIFNDYLSTAHTL